MAEFSVTKSAQELLADQMWKMLAEIGVDPTFKDSEGFEMDADGVLLEIARIMIERLPTEEPEWAIEYGVRGDVDSPMSSREAAEHAIERMAKAPRGYRLTRTLVERRVSPWVPVKQEGTEP